MSIALKPRRGTTAEHAAFTGEAGEITVDITANTLVVHDGVTSGGFPIGGGGTVTSVGLSVPTGLSVSGSPITDSGVLAISLTAGYVIPTTTEQSNWNTAFGWGDHAGLYAAAVHNHTLDSLSNVTITAIASGEILKWNGSAWINNTLAEAGIAAAVHEHSADDITSGTLPVTRGGTGIASYTTGNYIKAGAGTVLVQRTPAQVLSDIGAAAEVHVHSIPQLTSTTLDAGSVGKHHYVSAGVTVPASTFSVGDAVTIVNSSTSDITITQGASVTMYLAGTATTGNRTLAQKGVATLLCVATNTFIISGGGLT